MTDPQSAARRYMQLFDDALVCRTPGKVSPEGRASLAEGPAGVLAAMIAAPSEWRVHLGDLNNEALWSDSVPQPPLDMPQTMVLGLLVEREMVARPAGQAEAYERAAVYWYRSALMLVDERPGLLCPLDYAGRVLHGAAVAAQGRGRTVVWGHRLEYAFEQAMGVRVGRSPSAVARCNRTHETVLANFVWLALGQGDPALAYRLVVDAWVATGRPSVLRAGLDRMMRSADRGWLDRLARAVDPEALDVLLDCLRTGRSEMSDVCRRNVVYWAMQVLGRSSSISDSATRRLEVLNSVLEFAD